MSLLNVQLCKLRQLLRRLRRGIERGSWKLKCWNLEDLNEYWIFEKNLLNFERFLECFEWFLTVFIDCFYLIFEKKRLLKWNFEFEYFYWIFKERRFFKRNGFQFWKNLFFESILKSFLILKKFRRCPSLEFWIKFSIFLIWIVFIKCFKWTYS
jgi:hypothetical protein